MKVKKKNYGDETENEEKETEEYNKPFVFILNIDISIEFYFALICLSSHNS